MDFRRLFRLDREGRADVDAEIAAHLAMRRDELIAQGMSDADATREAQRRFGDIDRTTADIVALEHSRQQREWWHEVVQDVRYAVRLLRRSPVFTIIAVLTLALGVGATGAIFSIVRQVLLAPLSFPHQEQLVRAWPADPRHDIPTGVISAPDLESWQTGQHAFTDLAGFWYKADLASIALTGDGPPESLDPAYVTPTFFRTLGAAAEVGRTPRPDEMQESGDRVVVLDDGLWRRRFGADPSIVGRVVTLDGAPYVVVGVMPPTMRFPGTTRAPDIWLSAFYQSQDATPWKLRDVRWLEVVGRLRPGMRPDDARAALATVQRRLATTFPDADHGWDAATIRPLIDTIVGDVRPVLIVMLGAVGFVLLIAVINVAGLLLARASARTREFAVRAALGGRRERLARQIMTESLVLALLGGIAGLIVARLTLHVALGLAASELPRVPADHLDWTVVALTFAIAIICGLLFSAIPALRSTRLLGTRGAATLGAEGQRLRQAFVIAQVAIAMALVCGAGLMVRSLERLLSTDPGFRIDHALAVRFTIPAYRYRDTADARFFMAVLDRVRAVPGVVSVGSTKILPLEGGEESWRFEIDGEPPPPKNEEPTAGVFHVSDDYFRTMAVPVIAGREFTSRDTLGAPDVIVVNEAFARQYVPGPVAAVPGRLIRISGHPVQIVGVVRDFLQYGLEDSPRASFYVDNAQNLRGTVTMVVRTRADPAAMTSAIRAAIWSVDKDQPIGEVTTLTRVVDRSVARTRLLSTLLDLFGSLGLALGALGIYGVIAYMVRQRQAEIGIRVALGADANRVLAMVMARGAILTAIGIAIGLVVALVGARGMRAVLFQIAPTDLLTYATVIALLAVVALIATYIPARGAARADPVAVLRAE
jgi:predicted permease